MRAYLDAGELLLHGGYVGWGALVRWHAISPLTLIFLLPLCCPQSLPLALLLRRQPPALCFVPASCGHEVMTIHEKITWRCASYWKPGGTAPDVIGLLLKVIDSLGRKKHGHRAHVFTYMKYGLEFCNSYTHLGAAPNLSHKLPRFTGRAA